MTPVSLHMLTVVLAISGCAALAWLVLQRFERKLSARGRAVFVTGCDNRGGFGRLIACELASAGYYVFAGCQTTRGVDDIAVLRHDHSEYQTVNGILLDVCDNASVASCCERVATSCITRDLELWAVVNNAGLHDGALVDWTSIDCFQKVMAVNFFGAVRCTQAFLPLIKRARGRIVNVSSIDGLRPLPAIGAYSASKFALEAFSDALRWEMAAFAVRVVAVNPGTYSTPLAHGAVERLRSIWFGCTDETRAEYGEAYFERAARLGHAVTSRSNKRPREVAVAVLRAVSSMSPKRRYIVGTDARLWRLLSTCLPEWVLDAAVPLVLRMVLGTPIGACRRVAAR